MNKKQYRIFVAGVPSGVSSKTVESYFRSFGPITAITEIDRRVEDAGIYSNDVDSTIHPFEIMRGVCCVITPYEQTYNAILGTSNHCIKKRTIMCSPYKSKKAAIKENRKNNKRRIIIKRVPSSIEEGIIKDSIEYLFGPISVFFSFLPEAMQVKNPYRNRRLHKSYSVMFTDKQSAQLAVDAGKFFLRGYGELAIEPFRQDFN